MIDVYGRVSDCAHWQSAVPPTTIFSSCFSVHRLAWSFLSHSYSQLQLHSLPPSLHSGSCDVPPVLQSLVLLISCHPQHHVTTEQRCWTTLPPHWLRASAEPASLRNWQNDPAEMHRPLWAPNTTDIGSTMTKDLAAPPPLQYHLTHSLITFFPCYRLSSPILVLPDFPNTTFCLILCRCQQQFAMHSQQEGWESQHSYCTGYPLPPLLLNAWSFCKALHKNMPPNSSLIASKSC